MCGLHVLSSVELWGVLSPTLGPEDATSPGCFSSPASCFSHSKADSIGCFSISALCPSASPASSESLFSSRGLLLVPTEHLLLPSSLWPAGSSSPTAGSDAFREERGRKEKANLARPQVTCPVQHTSCQVLAESSHRDLGNIQLTQAGTVKANILPAPAGPTDC